MPKVSVIVPNYNHAPYLEQRIESVLNQSYQDFELILLDDCSTDNSIEVLSKYATHPKVSHYIVNEQNSGSTFKQWDKGINLAVGEWIWIAESDDWAEREFLERMIKNGEKGENTVISYCQSSRVNSKSEISGNWKDWTDDLSSTQFEKGFIVDGICYISNFLVHRNTIPNASAVLFRKSAYLNAGRVDSDIRYVSDWLLWLKLLLVGDISFESTILNNFRYHETSVIATALHSSSYQFKYKYDIILRKRYLKYCQQNKVIKQLFINKLSFESQFEAKLLMSKSKNSEALGYWMTALIYDNDKLRLLFRVFYRYAKQIKKMSIK